ncbi:Selenoprotein O and cysteine-containing [Salmonella enterica subsp. arizonae]|uniref:Selenoprotein O and cysteine-containing n=1 Tax=Salmonella enterica subsp. arizonae TaxID=59203 RepID=A0A379TBM1_SALER|nr:Selenoprotein O and cysteine-containing [Salmonella enterica subsp. arizonae]
MTLSFTAHWRDELPATYTALLPTTVKKYASDLV